MTKGFKCDKCENFAETATEITRKKKKTENINYIDGEAKKEGEEKQKKHLCEPCTEKFEKWLQN